MIKPVISICIPTINRPLLLLRALRSIEVTQYKDTIEVCISNNASNLDYSEVLTQIDKMRTAGIQVNYIFHEKRMSLDENMLFCTRMSQGEYIYYLGDDDFFTNSGVDKLFEIIKFHNPTLVILRGASVDEVFSGGLVLKTFDSPLEAFTVLHKKTTFGTVLVSRDVIDFSIFEKAIGTCHGYSSFWVQILNQKMGGNYYCESPFITLGAEGKTSFSAYYLSVIYDCIPKWYSLIFVLTKEMYPSILKFKEHHLKLMLRPARLLLMKSRGVLISNIPSILGRDDFWFQAYIRFVNLCPIWVSTALVNLYIRLSSLWQKK